MPVPKAYQADLDAILEMHHANGGEYWATADGRWGVGSPFSTFDCALILTELGLKRSDPMMKGAAETILAAWREDGRIRPAPKGAIYPCHTANAARALGRLGYARDKRLKKTFDYLAESQHTGGGWRCNTVRLGKSNVTDASNPGVTLAALDALRFSGMDLEDARLKKAAKTLLDHWKTRVPLGPCSFGIGTLFLQVEYPFLRYNLFYFVHVLSFYPSARKSKAFGEALRVMESKTQNGKVVVENPNRRLAKFAFCRKGEVSAAATKRWREIVRNVGSD